MCSRHILKTVPMAHHQWLHCLQGSDSFLYTSSADIFGAVFGNWVSMIPAADALSFSVRGHLGETDLANLPNHGNIIRKQPPTSAGPRHAQAVIVGWSTFFAKNWNVRHNDLLLSFLRPFPLQKKKKSKRTNDTAFVVTKVMIANRKETTSGF